ncbi:HVA22/TB2/DP1 family protein [Phanerochaete sordida]|uniref:Protein YOP1 n=1 Tax=Phanerochaete sordida TaxID=48140 RepID=A0A9P3GDU2_9APHY|nr:HVA22/TB2/DP1 family protein [Phanerochaete sordida]
MLFYLLFRLISAVCVFLYPGYASYKTLSQRPASEEELERWLMYWSVLGCIVAVEYVGEWLIFWIPFYYPVKTLFLLWLALPQTAGASYLYAMHIQPFFASHETEIDSALTKLKNYVYNYLQRVVRNLWSHVVASTGPSAGGDARPDALDEGGLTGEAAVHAGAPPTLSDPLSGPAQLVQTFWRSYGPAVVAAGAGLMAQAKTSARESAAAAEEAMDTPPAGPSRMQSSASVLERRRQLEAELAALEAHPGLKGYDAAPPQAFPPADAHSRTSSSSSLRERTGGNGRFEEVEIPSDMESEGLMSPDAERPPPPTNRGSWFGWGGKPQGYERVKTD